MDEAIRIYNPKGNILVASLPKAPVSVEKKIKSIYAKESRYETIKGIFAAQKKEEKELSEKYPAFNVFYNWGTMILILILIFGFIQWGVRSSNERKVNSLVAVAMADYQAEQQAIADQEAEAKRLEAQSEAVVQKKIAEKLALVYQGADKFVEKYGYSERDFKTLGRCIFNRVENKAYSNDIFEVIVQQDQWVGYYGQSGSPMDKYYKMALKHVQEWRTETTKPCSNDYLWAEYTPRGIFLKDTYNAGPYDTRWRAEN